MLFLPSQLLFCTHVPINHSDPTSDSLPMRGLEATGNDRIALTFHVIVPVACWEWDSESRIHIRFGHNELGNWRDCGEFTSRCTHVVLIGMRIFLSNQSNQSNIHHGVL